MNSEPIHVVGGGPAGLTAAISLAKKGVPVIVHEKNDDVGSRFNGDFQGIENWTLKMSVPQFLESLGIEVNFYCKPFHGGEFYGPDMRMEKIQTPEPLFYLIKRGGVPDSLDQGLKRQALEAGVKFQWNDNRKQLPSGTVILATGPRFANAIARGLLFKTTHEDYCAGFLNDEFAPKAYAYLLVSDGLATFATCMFEDFRNNQLYYKRAFATMKKVVDIDIHEPHEFGGYINVYLGNGKLQEGSVYYVGERAGFQDALWGFGIKHAMLSGSLAARSILNGENYEELCRKHIYPVIKSTVVNRWVYAWMGNTGYRFVLRRMRKSADVLVDLRKFFRWSPLKRMLYPLAKTWFNREFKFIPPKPILQTSETHFVEEVEKSV